MSKEIEVNLKGIIVNETLTIDLGSIPDNIYKRKKLGEFKPGEIAKIGEYEFIVLEQMNGQTKVISKELLAENENFGISRDYRTSRIKNIIEKEIQPIIEKAIGTDNLIKQ